MKINMQFEFDSVEEMRKAFADLATSVTTAAVVETPPEEKPPVVEAPKTKTKAKTEKPVTVVEVPKVEVVETPPDHGTFVLTDEAPKTIEDVRVLAKALMNKGHNARLQEEMTKLGATRLSEIKDYDEAFGVLEALAKEVGL